MSEPVTIDDASAPRLATHASLLYDEHRGRWVMVVPDRVLFPDDIAVDVLHRCDGRTSVAAIAGQLAEVYDAPARVIGRDVTELMQSLADEGYLEA